MRVLHVIRGLANSSGTTHIVGPLSEAQARLGCEVSVFHVQKGSEPAVEPDASLVRSRCFPMTLPMPNPGVSWGFARAISREISGFDVVHVHAVWNFPTYYSMRAARRAGVPYVVAPQGSFEPWAMRQNPLGKRLYGQLTEVPLLQRAAYLQALTETEREQFARFGLRAPVAVVPNGIAPGAFDGSAPPLSRRLGLPEGQKTLLFLSRLHPKKGLDVLVDAFARLASARDDITLVVAGHDAGSGYGAQVQGWLEERGLAGRSRMIGEVRGEEKREVLLGADAFVLPSHSEGLPVAAVEAMAAGLPVVVTPGCNLPEVAAHGAGWVVPAKGAAVAGALEALFGDPATAGEMGARGRRLVAEKFTWPQIALQLQDVYASAFECSRRIQRN